jgi:hypothetical protein
MVSLPPGMRKVPGATPHRCRTNGVLLAGRPNNLLANMVFWADGAHWRERFTLIRSRLNAGVNPIR